VNGARESDAVVGSQHRLAAPIRFTDAPAGNGVARPQSSLKFIGRLCFRIFHAG
jgi:hypothetical protein